MKYIVLVADGMADLPLEELGARTPLEAARTPNMDFMAANGKLGRVKTIPDKMTPGSDIANISILGYNPKTNYTGRGPLEAANIGIQMQEGDIIFRCNLITAIGDKLIDYSAGHISSREAKILMEFLDKRMGGEKFRFYPGTSYRNLLKVNDASQEHLENLLCIPPHDILGQSLKKHMPKGKNSEVITSLMLESRKILEAHEINQVRLDLKENPANMIWLWGQGTKPRMSNFQQKYKLSGSVISAVDLIKGLGRIIGLDVIEVQGATGYYDTNYAGKAKAALKSLEKNDFVFVHVEAPDEAGHNGDLREKILAIERFDQFIVGKILNTFKKRKDFRIMVLPDHPTPISLRTHSAEEVPFVIFGKDAFGGGFLGYSEKESKKSTLYIGKGHELMDYFLELPE